MRSFIVLIVLLFMGGLLLRLVEVAPDFQLLDEEAQDAQWIEATEDSESNLLVDYTVSGQYLAAHFAYNQGMARSALDMLQGAMAVSAENPSLYHHAYQLSLASGDLSKAAQYAEKIEEDVTQPSWIVSPRMVRALAAIARGDAAQAEEQLKQLQPQGFEAIMQEFVKGWVAIAQSKAANWKELEGVYKVGGELKPYLGYQLAILAQAQLEAKIGDADQMQQLAKRYFGELELLPQLSYAQYTHLARHYQKQNQPAKLAILVEQTSQQHGMDLPHALSLIQAPVSLSQGVAYLYGELATVLNAYGSYEQAMIPLKIAIALDGANSIWPFTYGKAAEQEKQNQIAIESFEALKADAVLGNAASRDLAYLYQRQGLEQKGLELAKTLAKQQPHYAEAQTLLADILRMQHKYAESAAVYSRIIEGFDPVEAQHWPYYFSRAVVYEREGKWEKAEQDLLEALRLSPDQADVLNYLGYSWLTQNRQITQARAMIEKALAVRPKDAHIVDSMGWALYHSGEFEKARSYLESALQLAPADATINEHLGDVYWQLGYERQARFQWQKALGFGPTEKGQAAGIEEKLANGMNSDTIPKKSSLSQNGYYQLHHLPQPSNGL